MSERHCSRRVSPADSTVVPSDDSLTSGSAYAVPLGPRSPVLPSIVLTCPQPRTSGYTATAYSEKYVRPQSSRSRAYVHRVLPVAGSRPSTSRPSPVTTLPATTNGVVVFGLGAVRSCRRKLGTTFAVGSVGAGVAAGRLMVALASLVHQIRAATIATTAAIATAASTSPLVRRSGLTIRRR